MWLQGLSIFALLFAVFHMVRAYQTVPRVDPPTQPAASPYVKALAGSGIVEPETENISIGSNVPGIVQGVAVKVGEQVEAGDLLFTLDPRQLKAEEIVREAAVRAARAQLDRLEKQRKEEIPVTEARVREAEAALREAEDMFARGRSLVNQAVLAREEQVTRERAVQVARAQLARVQAELTLLRSDAWKAELEVAKVAVTQAESQLKATRTELERLEVRALESGQVLQVNVRPGEFVGAPPGQALIVLGNTDRLHVRVDINEYDIPRFDPAMRATATFRGDTKERFPLTFVRVEPYVIPKKSLTGNNTERVDTRVLQVIYRIDSLTRPTFVGQQLEVYFDATSAPTPLASATNPSR
jgi:multidrug resistance efflux pump